MSINLGAIVPASLGLMGRIVGALAHNLGSILVVLNSALILRHRWDNAVSDLDVTTPEVGRTHRSVGVMDSAS